MPIERGNKPSTIIADSTPINSLLKLIKYRPDKNPLMVKPVKTMPRITSAIARII
jgi:hypothetical protein